MSGPSGEQCRFCYYCADPGAVDEHTGICRRHPAPTTEVHGRDHKVWVGLRDWCGEFKLAPKMGKHLWRHLPHDLVHEDEMEPR
jgi:hypothetical protein